MWLQCACALALLCAARASPETEKRAEMAPMPFVLGSRYGRSPPRQLAPRNDRFFMGSRYGKRSEPVLTLTRPAALSSLADRQDALMADRQARLTSLTGRQPVFAHRHSPSVLWQVAALIAGRTHRTFEEEP